MREWPPITEPELLARLALSDQDFHALTGEISKAWGRREYVPASLERALGYPWERPAGSYVLRDNEVDVLADLDPARYESVVESFTSDRHPILAFGGNGSPSYLTAKFAHFPSQADKDVLVLTGDLLDHDVGAAASITPLGNMAGTLFASPGTSVRAAMVWCTTAQITQLTWSEVPYHLGRLDDASFEMDETDVEVEQVFAYISRFGAFCVDDEPIALAAVPARNRTARSFVQQDLLDFVAPRLIGPDARAEDVVRAVYEDMAGVITSSSNELWHDSRQLESPWTPYPASKEESIRQSLLELEQIPVPRRPGFVGFTVTAVEAGGLDVQEVAGFITGHDGVVDTPSPFMRDLIPDGPEMDGYEPADVVTFEIPGWILDRPL